MSSKTLALDIGGVCMRLTPQRVYEAIGLDPNAPLPNVIVKLIDDYNCGTVSNEQFADGMRRFTGRQMSDDQARDIWNLFLSTEIESTTRFLEKLWNAGWKIVWFSDTQPWHTDSLIQTLPYSSKIDGAIYSFIVGAQKPSPKMYEAFEAKYGKPDLYIDDRLNNIEGGLARGWNAIQYKGEDTIDTILAGGIL